MLPRNNYETEEAILENNKFKKDIANKMIRKVSKYFQKSLDTAIQEVLLENKLDKSDITVDVAAFGEGCAKSFIIKYKLEKLFRLTESVDNSYDTYIAIDFNLSENNQENKL